MRKSPQSDRLTAILQETRKELAPYLQRLDFRALAKHNQGYLQYRADPVRCFVDWEIGRYTKTASFLASALPAGARVIDVGFFIPYLPLVLAKCGFQITCVEKMSLYNGALDELADFAQSHYNIIIRDFDTLAVQSAIAVERYDAALLLAVIEHLNGSPRVLIQRLKELMRPHGILVLEVPNVATLERRIGFLLKGAPPFPPMSDYFHSEYPFTGHNREYTLAEIEYVLKESGFVVEKIDAFHHNPIGAPGWKARLIRLLERLGPRTWRPCIWACGRSA